MYVLTKLARLITCYDLIKFGPIRRNFLNGHYLNGHNLCSDMYPRLRRCEH